MSAVPVGRASLWISASWSNCLVTRCATSNMAHPPRRAGAGATVPTDSAADARCPAASLAALAMTASAVPKCPTFGFAQRGLAATDRTPDAACQFSEPEGRSLLPAPRGREATRLAPHRMRAAVSSARLDGRSHPRSLGPIDPTAAPLARSLAAIGTAVPTAGLDACTIGRPHNPTRPPLPLFESCLNCSRGESRTAGAPMTSAGRDTA